jgi:hypothetical protein
MQRKQCVLNTRTEFGITSRLAAFGMEDQMADMRHCKMAHLTPDNARCC